MESRGRRAPKRVTGSTRPRGGPDNARCYAPSVTLLATWWRDGTHAEIRDESDGLWARLQLMDDWYPEGSRAPVRAWTVEWLDQSCDDPALVRAHLDVAA